MFEKNPAFPLKHNNFRVGKVFKERFFLHQFAAVNAKLMRQRVRELANAFASLRDLR